LMIQDDVDSCDIVICILKCVLYPQVCSVSSSVVCILKCGLYPQVWSVSPSDEPFRLWAPE
jgi:hypothetical protein